MKKMSDMIMFSQCLIWFTLRWENFGDKLRNTDFKFSWNSLIFFNQEICDQIKICHGLYKWFRIKKISKDFKIYWNTLMKMLYLEGCKWLLSQNQGVRNYYFGYSKYEALAKHIKSLKKTLKWMDVSVLTIKRFSLVFVRYYQVILFFDIN